ncbi:hypothetical protein EVAR_80107_1 [Eumeta japonica]|uniref:Immunoglobulin domain-containing protein n=1 Tax=Eumeta variegata TaxID=151549 RepID=A0A4C1UE96_EUMVA|nr:hypothetical protein EVAR_80107_1 [Eumeta japonica]
MGRKQHFIAYIRRNLKDAVAGFRLGTVLIEEGCVDRSGTIDLGLVRPRVFCQVGWLRAEDQTVLSLHERAVLGARYSAALDPPRTWQLRIRPLRAEDRGCYMCQINTQPTMKWQIGCIDVYGRLYNVLALHERAVLGARYSAALDPPRTWQLRIRPLRAEDRGCYMCQINTQPTMKWQIGCINVYGRLYNVLALHERAVLGARYSAALDPPRTWQLRIRPLRVEDRGCYMCQINTQPTMKWQIGCIDVYGRLYNVLALHERAVLGARYSAALDPPRTWRLRIQPLRAEDYGCYMCQINTQPTMKWQIGCIDVYGRLYNVLALHERAVLGARYSAALDPPRTWQLRIQPLRAEDYGCYMCQINTQPTMKWQIGCINVYGRLYNVLALHERAVLGARYSAALDPPRTWQLRIQPLRAEDYGCYMCQINTQPTMKWQIGCIDVYGRLYNVLSLHERALLGRAGPAAHVAAAHPAAARRGPRLLHVPDQHAAHHEVTDRLYRRLRSRPSPGARRASPGILRIVLSLFRRDSDYRRPKCGLIKFRTSLTLLPSHFAYANTAGGGARAGGAEGRRATRGKGSGAIGAICVDEPADVTTAITRTLNSVLIAREPIAAPPTSRAEKERFRSAF